MAGFAGGMTIHTPAQGALHPWTYKVLAVGTLSNAKAVLYTAPASPTPGSAVILLFMLTNITAGALVPSVYVRDAAAVDTQIYGTSIGANTALYLVTRGDVMPLQPGWSIAGNTSAGASITYYIGGAEFLARP